MKYSIVCCRCGRLYGSFAEWFAADQKCSCGSTRVEVRYPEAPYARLREIASGDADSFYKYFDFLPLEDRSSIVSLGEGAIPLERWESLEGFARRNGVSCKVYVYRNDLNGGTGTFKDISASLAASVMKEQGVKEYCLASTGNAGTSFATYLAEAGVKFSCFSPSFVDKDTAGTIRATGQNLVISEGDYGTAKAEAAKLHAEKGVLISSGNTDPLRIESKRTMVFEFLRQLGSMPTVFMQAVAGGTSPIALEKGFREIHPYFPEEKMPRMLLVQQDECDPMVSAWEKAVRRDFPEGWETDYEEKKNVHTRIGILTAANPGNYPILAPMVRRSGGAFLRVEESSLPEYGRRMLRENGILMGPASVVCYAGFFKAVLGGHIRNGDVVVLNCGEGASRAAWFVEEVDRLSKQGSI